MAWVRYDDHFHEHRKVGAVILDDPGALGLHLLANTWTNAQEYVGFVPIGQPSILLCDRGLGAKWAATLVNAGLWHERGKECDRCREIYADLPADFVGYVFHDSKDYRSPTRERQTPGTPAELSAKRQAAGRKGGRSTAARREHVQQDARANAANGASKTSNLVLAGVSPVPVPGPEPLVASNEATSSPSVGDPATPRRSRKPVDPDAPKKADAVVAAFVDGATRAGQDPPTKGLIARVGRDAKRLLAEDRVDIDKLLAAAGRMGRGGWQSLDVQLQRMSAERVGNGRDSPRDGRTVSTEESLRNGWLPDEAAS
jgi:hypothetical protein